MQVVPFPPKTPISIQGNKIFFNFIIIAGDNNDFYVTISNVYYLKKK